MRPLALVTGEDPGSLALHRHLAREWVERRGGGPCELLAGPLGERELAAFATVVYAAAWRAGGEVDLPDARAVLSAAAAAGCRLLAVSSTEVHRPHHHHPGFVAEDRPAPRIPGNRVSDAWAAFEATAAAIAAERGRPLAILRAAPAPVPGGHDAWSRFFGRRLVLTLPGRDPSIQLLAMEDLARAIAAAAASDATGTFHVVPAGTVPVRRAVRLAGGRRLPVPGWLQRIAGRERIDFLRHPWTAGGDKARRELGLEPALSSAEVAASFRSVSLMAHEGPLTPGAEAPLTPALSPEAERGRSGVRLLRAEVECRHVDAAWEWGPEGFDRYGMDRGYVARHGRTLFRFLHDAYWRIEVRGLEHVPREGPGVLTGVHRGFMPFDGVMALHLLVRERGRYPRFLLHPTLVKFPYLADFMTKLGGVLACRENGDWVLERGGLLGVFPEGIQGAFTPYRRAYRLGRMGRDEYVRLALRNRAPILPFVTAGSAEIFPVLARLRWPWWQRLTEWPCFPVAPPFPLLPVPLPSKWHTRFLEPLHVEEEHGPGAAEDPATVRAIGREVRRRMQAALDDLLARRRHVFFGALSEAPERTGPRRDRRRGGGG